MDRCIFKVHVHAAFHIHETKIKRPNLKRKLVRSVLKATKNFMQIKGVIEISLIHKSQININIKLGVREHLWVTSITI